MPADAEMRGAAVGCGVMRGGVMMVMTDGGRSRQRGGSQRKNKEENSTAHEWGPRRVVTELFKSS
jgi:hypothetical protein